MQEEKLVVGLDIGTTKICAIVGRKNKHGKLEVLGMGKAISDGVIRGIVTNIDKTIMAIERAIAQAAEIAKIDIGEVNVGIAGQHIKSAMHSTSITRDQNDDEITVDDLERLKSDIHKLMMPPGNQIIHVMPQDYIVDYEDGIKDPVGMSGVKVEADFHVITAQTNAIKNINKCVRRANLQIENLILEPIASSMAVLSDEEKEAGVCLVDIGGGTTDVAIFHDGIIRHTAVIPFGGNIVTEDIKEGLKVMQNQAEQLKTKFGKAIVEEANPNEIVSIPGLKNRPPKEISIRNLAHIIESRMQEIIELVHKEILTSGYASKLAGGIVVTGGGSQLLNIQQLFEYMTGMDARIGYPNEHLGKSEVEEIKSPMYATTVGLVLSGFRALDERDDHYERMNSGKPKVTTKPKDKPTVVFKNLLSKVKDVLTEDVGDNEDY